MHVGATCAHMYVYAVGAHILRCVGAAARRKSGAHFHTTIKDASIEKLSLILKECHQAGLGATNTKKKHVFDVQVLQCCFCRRRSIDAIGNTNAFSFGTQFKKETLSTSYFLSWKNIF